MIIARFRSRSPKGYAIVARICGIVAAFMAGYIVVYQCDVLPATQPVWANINSVCVVAGAAFSALGLGAASTTTDPDLMSKETKANVLNEECK